MRPYLSRRLPFLCGALVLAGLVGLHDAAPAHGQMSEGIPESWGRFVAVKEFAGTFTISFEHATRTDPDPHSPGFFESSERWSVGGTLELKQEEEMPNSWTGDGQASMQIAVEVTEGRRDPDRSTSVHGSGRTPLVTEAPGELTPRLALVWGGDYWLSFGSPGITADYSTTRLSSGETHASTPRCWVTVKLDRLSLPERGQRLRGRREVSASSDENGFADITCRDANDWATWSHGWDSGDPAQPKAVVTWDLAPVVHEYRVEVEIPGYADWYPKAGRDESVPGADLTVRARLVDRGGRPAESGVIKTWWFELEDVSREPGVAMNWPPPARAKRDPDLRFDRDRNFQLPVWVSSDERSVEVQGLEQEPEVVLTSYDWGGHGILRVSAELQDGRTVYGALKEEAGRLRIPIPKRRDGSRIAEHFRARIGERRDEADDETKPRPQATRGDGLSVYQEYRGFYENGEHVRGDLERKDLFVHVSADLAAVAEPGIRRFEAATGLKVHAKLSEAELGDDEVINPNQGASGAPRQHGLRMLRENLNVNGRAWRRDPNMAARSPGDVDRISIHTGLDPRSVRRNGQLHVSQYFTRVVAHELGHGVGIRHHGEIDRRGTWQLGADGVLSEGGVPIRVFSESGALLRPRRSASVWLGVSEGQHSGDQACFMRYVVSSAYRADGQPDVRYWVAGTEPLGLGLCKNTTGTGVNAPGRSPQPRYGHAGKGDCEGQIRVRDQ